MTQSGERGVERSRGTATERDGLEPRPRSTRSPQPEVLDGDALDSAPGAESGRAISSGEPVAGFYDAVVTRLSRGLETGEIRTGGGRLVGFSFAFVKMLPAGSEPGDLEVGARVGVDVGWTSRGLRVTTIRIPSEAQAHADDAQAQPAFEAESPALPSMEPLADPSTDPADEPEMD